MKHHRSYAAYWELLVTTDRFAATKNCRLRARNGEAFVDGAAIAFVFPKGWNTQGAIYRTGGDAPRRWREDLPEILRIGAPMDRGSVENPAQGLVWIPLRRLDGVNAIEIQPQPGKAARIFRFHGMKGLYQSALSQGCIPVSRTVK
ncbi:hypothetical protein [Novosphingobium sp. MMS21-SN21R]|uniref:hypothetical protein n=1 Tax=Novosphingobium sp. MMS21-SN21R TaxID=2969298 RepID=UPI0028874685|nr:hypothetical protein [Novosphingobium sp. MMS21-SN21R]MDT0507341.1 hypothetical protein [Novosphingobium sp. MMS21-SN21R]